MKVPDKIYLQVCMECNQEDCENCKFDDLANTGNVTWCRDRIYQNDKVFVNEDALYGILKKYEKSNLPAKTVVIYLKGLISRL